MKKCLFIYNPRATKVNKITVDRVISKLKNSYDLDIQMTLKPHDVTKLVIDNNELYDVIITMGGDGTLSEAIFGFLKVEQKALYGHIPAGTTNDFAVNMNMPRFRPSKSVERIINGSINDIDVVSVENRPFAYVSALGYMTNIPYVTPYSLKQKFGYVGYVIEAIELMKKDKERYHIVYEVNGNIEDTYCYDIFVSNSVGFGGVKIFNDANIRDGLFEVTIVKDIDQGFIYQVLGDFVKNKININNYKKHITYIKTDYLKVTFDSNYPDMSIDNDGDDSNIYVNEKNKKLEYKICGKIKMLY